MQSAPQRQDQFCTLTHRGKTEYEPKEPKLSDRYIVVCPRFFEDSLMQHLDRIDTYTLRDEETKYRNELEDQWSNYLSDGKCYASIFITKDTGERLIYCPSPGKLFSCNDIIEAGKILEELKKQEDLKIIS